ncbi:hypothetical protein GPX89_01990 [Nocardia sp. ET3-3]|uniref:Uncharacterized protein n=1 Tax=Nocardia terrae TaxID=2675851 RepID=A0A7K1UNU0_9NOCA|nr:hypothetical protein [Nocardia terrae]MVU76012.1 hypothetical protein [Nocardia terrae]
MTSNGIVGAQNKLARARQHLDELERAVAEFHRTSPYTFRGHLPDNNPDASSIPFEVRVATAYDVPDSWPLIVGDILTNLRAALDHAVFNHVKATRPSLPDKDIQFPIEDQCSQFENKRKRFIPAIRQVVGDAQPYRTADPQKHPLHILRRLVNIDKHRSLIVVDYASMRLELGVSDNVEVLEARPNIGAEMTVGTIVATGHLRVRPEAQAPVQTIQFSVKAGLETAIEINDAGELGLLVPTMQDLCDAVGKVLNNLQQNGI